MQEPPAGFSALTRSSEGETTVCLGEPCCCVWICCHGAAHRKYSTLLLLLLYPLPPGPAILPATTRNKYRKKKDNNKPRCPRCPSRRFRWWHSRDPRIVAPDPKNGFRCSLLRGSSMPPFFHGHRSSGRQGLSDYVPYTSVCTSELRPPPKPKPNLTSRHTNQPLLARPDKA